MQTEKKSLNKREKRMMFLLIVVALFAVMVIYIIIPLYNQMEDKTTELGILETDQVTLISTLASEAAARDGNSSAIAQHNKTSERFLNEAASNDIGRLLTRLCENHGLRPVSQQLSDPKDFTTGEEDDADTPKSSVFLVTTAMMTINGEYDNIRRLLDTVEQTEYLRISRLAFNRNADVGSWMERVAITFEVTMLKDVKLASAEEG